MPDLWLYGDTMTIQPITLPQAIEFHADHDADKTAISYQDRYVSYGELDSRANQVANALRSRGLVQRQLVGIFLDRGPELIIAQLGILKAGGMFAVFDPRYPRDALRRVMPTIPLSLVITSTRLTAGFPEKSIDFLHIDDATLLEKCSKVRPIESTSLEDPALVLFTSGSTGQPKPVLHTHRNIIARFSNTASISGFGHDSVLAQISPLSSIDAIDEMLIPLYRGGISCILPYDIVANPELLIRKLWSESVTHLLLVPSLLRVLLSVERFSELKALQVCMVGGETLTGTLAHQFYEKVPHARLMNYYGLTEGDISFHYVEPGDFYSGFVPVGRPIQNTKVYVLNESHEMSAVGERGEICVAGDGLFREYLGRPELNAERWIPNPVVGNADGPFARIFRTGDIGRYNENGELEYLGRKDRMIKIRGSRVELEEVESVLVRHPDVRECIVVARENRIGNGVTTDKQLIAYVVPFPGKTVESSKLIAFASGALPDFAVPSIVLTLSEMPLSPNGKVDVQRLPDPVLGFIPKRDQDMAAPQNLVELQLARIWEKLLHRAPISIYDNFFEIGGDSLIAIELMLEIEKKLKMQLPISVLMQSPTIRSLAGIISHQEAKRWSSLVPIRSEGTCPPLFCVHADGGVLFYYSFAQYLDRTIPVYGLQARGLLGEEDEPLARIEDMATHYIDEIRTVQPSGPYHLCGYSTGGFIIFEMARQLRAIGEKVALVGMLDAYGPNYPQIQQNSNTAAYKLSVHLNALRMYEGVGRIQYLWARTWKRLIYIFSGSIERILQFLRLPLPHRIRYNAIARLVNRAETLYRPTLYEGDIVLFRASVQPDNICPDPYLGWRNYVRGNIIIHDIEGTHNSIMREPQLRQLVSAVQTCIAQ